MTDEQWRDIKAGDLLWSWAGPVLMIKGGRYNETPNPHLDFDYWTGVKANDLGNRADYGRKTLSLEPGCPLGGELSSPSSSQSLRRTLLGSY